MVSVSGRAIAARSVPLILLAVLLAACGGRLPGPALGGPQSAKSVYVISDGWHTGLVLAGAQISATAWPESADFARSGYVEVGWGDEGAYAADRLTTQLALGAAFRSGASALHVAGFDTPVTERFHAIDVVEVRLAPEAFDRLSTFIHQSYARDVDGKPIRLGRGYGDPSRFYRATGRYHVFNTCNTWTAKALRAAGLHIVPALTWTATQLMHQVLALDGIAVSGAVRRP